MLDMRFSPYPFAVIFFTPQENVDNAKGKRSGEQMKMATVMLPC